MNNKIFTFFISIFFLIITESFCQVSIGNTNPDPSSILDITSNTQGLLAPRMTSTQRAAISSPAEGLLVFDIDLNAFYYYDTDSSTWKKMTTDINLRNNYILVKSESDFPAPVGGIITLDENVLYEINGNITVSNSIDINNAAIIGHDIDEDVISKASGTLFVGSKGGEIKDITVTTSGGTIFNLNDTANNQELLVIEVKFINSTSIGTLAGYDLLSFSNCEYKGNTSGVTYSNIKDLFLNNQEWLDTNNGTYETFNGTFEVIEKEGGFSDVSVGRIAVDVSANPIVNRGVMYGVVFEGAGTYINKYTTVTNPDFNFTNEWFVDSPGVVVETGFVATGYFHMVNNATVTPLVTNNTPVKILGTTTADNLFRTTASDNRLSYVGLKAREFEIICTGTLNHTVNNARKYEFYVYKNGGQIPAISAERRFSKNDVGNFTLTGVLNLQPNDYVEVWISINNVSGVSSCLVERLSVVLK